MNQKTFCKCGSVVVGNNCLKTEQNSSTCDGIFHEHSDCIVFIKGGLNFD